MKRVSPGLPALVLLPAEIDSLTIRQAPARPAQNPRCYGGLAAFWGITAMAEVAEREGLKPLDWKPLKTKSFIAPLADFL